MKLNYKKIQTNILSVALLLCVVSCGELDKLNELQKDIASKNGVKLPNIGASANYPESQDFPDTLVAFLWPDEAYYKNSLNHTNRRADYNFPANDSFKNFLLDLKLNVFKSGDAFDALLLVGIKIEADMDAVLTEIKPFNRKVKKLKSDIKKIKNKVKTLMKALKTQNTLMDDALDTLEAFGDYDAILANNAHPQHAEVGVANNYYHTKKTDVADTQLELDTKNDDIASKTKEMKAIKKSVEYKELIADKEVIDAKSKHNNGNKSEMLTRVQENLDVAAVKFSTCTEEEIGEEDNSMSPCMPGQRTGSLIINQYNYVERVAQKHKQINWINTYIDSVDVENEVIVNESEVFIKFGEWGVNEMNYSNFEYDDEGDRVLKVKPDFININFDAKSQVIKFTMVEKNKNGVPTERLLKFTLQKSLFGGIHTRFLGDIDVLKNGKIVRKGQMKIVKRAID
jgi:hypothetical protein